MPTAYPRVDILLKYSSEAKRDEYRGTSPVVAPVSSLHFDLTPVTAAGGGRSQARFDGRVQFSPDIAIKGHFSIKALIDRMVVVVMLAERTSFSGIRKVIKDKLGASVAVSDVGVKCHTEDWTKRIILPHAMRRKGTNRVFAILIQDPTPDLVAGIVTAVDKSFKIRGDVLLTLLEVALDFYPRRGLAQAMQVRLREQMVGLLQRLHYPDTKELYLDKSDARQVFQKPDELCGNLGDGVILKAAYRGR